MDLFKLSKILTIFDWVCNGLVSIALIALGAFVLSQDLERLARFFLIILGILPLSFCLFIIFCLSLLNIGEYVGFVKKIRGLMIYSIFTRILWLIFYAGTFYLIQPFTKLSGLIVVPILLTTYGLARLILQIYIVVNFEELTNAEVSPAES